MTNPSISNREVLSHEEGNKMLEKANKIQNIYFRLRSKSLLSTFDLTGKRRVKVATLQQEDVKVQDPYLSITFTVIKNRKSEHLLSCYTHFN